MEASRTGTALLGAAMLLEVGCCPSPALVGASTAPDASQAAPAEVPRRFVSLPVARLSVTAGSVVRLDARVARVDVGGMRGIIVGGTGQAAEIAFTYRGPSGSVSLLANGELRRQIGLKLRAKNTCNVLYVMWHLAPDRGIFVSVKHNSGQSRHEECGASGYELVRNPVGLLAPEVRVGERHTLRAELEGHVLRLTADALYFEVPLPDDVFAFDGPAGVRSDNAVFDFELRVPAIAYPGAGLP